MDGEPTYVYTASATSTAITDPKVQKWIIGSSLSAVFVSYCSRGPFFSIRHSKLTQFDRIKQQPLTPGPALPMPYGKSDAAGLLFVPSRTYTKDAKSKLRDEKASGIWYQDIGPSTPLHCYAIPPSNRLFNGAGKFPQPRPRCCGTHPHCLYRSSDSDHVDAISVPPIRRA